jgi:hypothetical protein
MVYVAYTRHGHHVRDVSKRVRSHITIRVHPYQLFLGDKLAVKSDGGGMLDNHGDLHGCLLSSCPH